MISLTHHGFVMAEPWGPRVVSILAMDKPTAAEIRTAFAAMGVLGLIQLVRWAVSSPALKLWGSLLFLGACLALVALTVYGIIGFFTHWTWRATAPATIAIIYDDDKKAETPMQRFENLAKALVFHRQKRREEGQTAE